MSLSKQHTYSLGSGLSLMSSLSLGSDLTHNEQEARTLIAEALIRVWKKGLNKTDSKYFKELNERFVHFWEIRFNKETAEQCMRLVAFLVVVLEITFHDSEYKQLYDERGYFREVISNLMDTDPRALGWNYFSETLQKLERMAQQKIVVTNRFYVFVRDQYLTKDLYCILSTYVDRLRSV